VSSHHHCRVAKLHRLHYHCLSPRVPVSIHSFTRGAMTIPLRSIPKKESDDPARRATDDAKMYGTPPHTFGSFKTMVYD